MWTRTSVLRVEDRADGARPLQLVEPLGAGDEDAAVPEPPGGLALRGGRHDGTEEGRPLEGDDRRADLVADEVDRPLVAGPQDVVALVARRGVGELGGKADLLERPGDDGIEVLLP